MGLNNNTIKINEHIFKINTILYKRIYLKNIKNITFLKILKNIKYHIIYQNNYKQGTLHS